MRERVTKAHKTKKWHKYGTVMEVKKHRQYTVRIRGSGRLSLRNRRHLQKVIVYAPDATRTVLQKGNSPWSTEPLLSDQSDTISERIDNDILPRQDLVLNQNDVNGPTVQQTISNQDNVNLAIEDHQVPLRRSGRLTKKPTYYYDEYN